MKYDRLAALAADAGFTAWAPLDVPTIELKQEVRDMCASGACQRFGRCWSCPPACGTLEACAARLAEHRSGILVQSAGALEDSFDFEAMAAIEAAHKARFARMYAALRRSGAPVLALGAGACTRCAKCTCPDAPCRFPEQMVSSMEAYGMLVHEVCAANGLQYYYGPNRLAYTGCFLL